MYQIFDVNSFKEWVQAVNSLEGLDIFYLPEYCRVFQEEGMGEGHLFFCESEQGHVVYPFFLRKVNDISFFRDKLFSEYCDIISPYGYAGPVSSARGAEDLWGYFQDSFREYCRKNNVVTEFIRFHPILENYHYPLPDDLKVEKSKSIVVMDLTLSESEIWSGYKYNNRKNINRACKEGLKVLIEEDPGRFHEFLKIYRTTMDRRQAKARYYFSERFYLNIHRYLKGKFVYVYVLKDGEVISAELLLFFNRYIHSFLGGTLAQYYYCRPNNLLKHQIALWAKAKGLRFFVLGGGYEENDGIFQFKLSFAPQGVRDFYVGKRIVDQEAVALLEKMKNKNDTGQRTANNFFPGYREE